jgi:hypothetical protein
MNVFNRTFYHVTGTDPDANSFLDDAGFGSAYNKSGYVKQYGGIIGYRYLHYSIR